MDDPDMKKKAKEVSKKILSGEQEPASGADVKTAAEAGEQFIKVLESHIRLSGMSEEAVSAIDGFSASEPALSGDNYRVVISYTNDLHRESLDPEEYPEGLYDLAGLFDLGSVTHHSVRGMWKSRGITIFSSGHTPAYYFEENAIDDFAYAYGEQYHVVDILKPI